MIGHFNLKKKVMEFKGTKGEWKIDPLNPISIVDNSTDMVTNLICQTNGKSGEERKANAKLIAAAPELLKALTNLKDEVVRECNLGSDKSLLPMLGYVQDAILAIKKATE